MAWLKPSVCATWHGLGVTYVPCGMSSVVLRCHVGRLKPSLCATWHGLGLAHVACPMSYIYATWHGLDLAMWHVIA
jgi:hypothetical protein